MRYSLFSNTINGNTITVLFVISPESGRSLILKNILIKVCKVLTTINEGMTNTSPVKDGELSKDNCMSAVNSSTEFRNTNDTAQLACTSK